jgi:hypothetical protein
MRLRANLAATASEEARREAAKQQEIDRAQEER